MKHCPRCLMPATRPGSIFDTNGVCQACHNYDARKNVDWKARQQKFANLCDTYRRSDGYYDCIIPVSGGKDSHFQVQMMKMEMGMNPLLVTVGDPFTKTAAGVHNFRNLGETFGCDHILFNISIDLFRRVTRLAFENFCEPLRFVETAIYTVPFKMGVQLGIPLIVFGEQAAYEYGSTSEDNYSARDVIEGMLEKIDNTSFWLRNGVTRAELNSILLPNKARCATCTPDLTTPIYMSHFVPWSSVRNVGIAKRYGFRDLTHEWKREGCIEDFEQIDSMAYMIHLWLKYPKFGFQRTSDIVSRRIREGLLSVEEGKRLILSNDHRIDQKALDDFIGFLGYSVKGFWDVVEEFWNRDLFEKGHGIWTMKEGKRFDA